MADPTYFATAQEFGAWLAKHHATATELIVGFHKVHTEVPCMTWSESVDEALCYGWIDGHLKRIDDDRYTRRYTPRRPGSHWSNVNVKKMAELIKTNRMTPAGLAVFEARDQDNVGKANFETAYAFTPEMTAKFQSDAEAWAYWQGETPSYRKTATGWLMLAKQEATQWKRLERLMADCHEGRRMKQFEWKGKA